MVETSEPIQGLLKRPTGPSLRKGEGNERGLCTSKRKIRLDGPWPSTHCFHGDTGSSDQDVTHSELRSCRVLEWFISDGPMTDVNEVRDPEILTVHRFGLFEHKKENPTT